MKYVHYWILILLSFGLLPSLQAHETKPAIVQLDIQEKNEFILTLKVNIEALMANIDPKHSNTDDSLNVDRYNQLRGASAKSITQQFSNFLDGYQQSLLVKTNNKRVDLNFLSIEVPEIGDIRLSRESLISFSGGLPKTAQQLTWQYPKKYGDNVFKLYQNKKSIANLWLTNGKQTKSLALEKPNKAQDLSDYLWLGFLHILPKGLDHILFILGLFLLSTQFKPLFFQITSFTIAHTITLGLSIYGMISLPSLWVESLIALSIIYIAAENIFIKHMSRWRLFVVFCFGLLHGLGFASVLSEIGLNQSQFLASLLSFNLGVELGQLFVILLAYTIIGYWFKDKTWYRSVVVIPASIAIALMGLYWLYERTALLI